MTEDLFRYTSGPRNSKILIVGEAWGAEEASVKLPFVGQSGREFTKILSEAGIPRETCLLTNVVSARPPNNDFTVWLHQTIEKKDSFYGLHPLQIVKDGVLNLWKLIREVKPYIIIAAGNFPLWALTEATSISTTNGKKVPSGVSKWRGSQLFTRKEVGYNCPVLPIIHPASILRVWEDRFITVHDLRARAKRYLDGNLKWEIHEGVTIRELYASNYSPSYSLTRNTLGYWTWLASRGELWLSVDIETYKRRDLAVIGIDDGKVGLAIPLFYFDNAGTCKDYFTEDQEVNVLLSVKKLLDHSNVKIIGQNFAYDYQYLNRILGLKKAPSFDTMLAHHLCWPGTPKSLDYLASLYCSSYVYWKDESQEWDTNLSHFDMWRYNTKDLRATFEIAQELQKLLVKLNLTKQYEFQLKQWRLSMDMMCRGVRLDPIRREQVKKDLRVEAEKLETWLLNSMPEDIRYTSAGGYWFTSPTFQMKIFYEQLGLSPVLHKKTKRPTFNAEAFGPLRKQAPWLAPLFARLEAYRSVGVFNSHFLDINLSPDGRLRCNFNIAGTDTFRWSSSANGFGEGTNLQNIPKGDE